MADQADPEAPAALGGQLPVRDHRRRGGAARMTARTWRTARTHRELTELTAGWLSGRPRRHPSYPCRPDRETRPITDALITLNRAGYLTTCSQPTYDGPGTRQRAAVEGFVHDPYLVDQLRAAADAAGLVLIVHDRPHPVDDVDLDSGIVVTESDGTPFTWFGRHLGREAIEEQFPGCRRDATDELCRSAQVTAVDPKWGRTDLLWSTLVNAVNGMTDRAASEATP